MKKLMMAAAIVCVAAVSQAATVNWNSGTIYLPSTDGSLSSTKLTSTSGYTLEAFAWESLTESAVSFNAGDLYSWYTAGASTSADPFGGSLKAISGTNNIRTNGAASTANGVIDQDSGTNYGAVLYVLTNDSDPSEVWYMENSGSKAFGKTAQTLSNLASKVGGTGAATAWTAVDVPEPSSALLLMLGMAGLALRRRRA